jgi:hypothetical protein
MSETADFLPGDIWQDRRGEEWFVVWEPGQTEPHMVNTLHFLAPSSFIADSYAPLTRKYTRGGAS